MSAWADALEHLRSQGVDVEPGLTDEEAAVAEQRAGVAFPPDLRTLLAQGVPVSDGFPDWRAESEVSLRSWMQAPVEGVLFDVEHNATWHEGWGERPEAPEQAVAVARSRLDQAPALIPVYKHRYLPAEPAEAGNPVLSVHQSDIIVYGNDLASYLQVEFGAPAAGEPAAAARRIRLWSDLIL